MHVKCIPEEREIEIEREHESEFRAKYLPKYVRILPHRKEGLHNVIFRDTPIRKLKPAIGQIKMVNSTVHIDMEEEPQGYIS